MASEMRERVRNVRYVGVGECEEACRPPARLVHTVAAEQDLAQRSEPKRFEAYKAPGGRMLQPLVQEWEGLRHPSGQDVHRPRGRSEQGGETRHVGTLGEREAPFQHGDRGGDVPCAAHDLAPEDVGGWQTLHNDLATRRQHRPRRLRFRAPGRLPPYETPQARSCPSTPVTASKSLSLGCGRQLLEQGVRQRTVNH